MVKYLISGHPWPPIAVGMPRSLKLGLGSIYTFLASLGNPFFVALVLTMGCSSTPNVPTAGAPTRDWEKEAPPLQGQEAEDYRKIQSLYAGEAYDAALDAITKFENRHASGSRSAHVQNLFGLIHLKKKKPLQAVYRFRKAIQGSSDKRFQEYIRYNLATAQYSANQFSEAQSTIATVNIDDLDQPTRKKFHYLRGLIHFQLKNFRAAAEEALTSAYFFSSTDTNTDIQVKLLNYSLDQLQDPGIMSEIYDQHSSSPLADVLLFRMARIALEKKQAGTAEENFKKLVANHPNSPYAADAMDYLRRIQGSADISPNTIGVLLPMTGKFARIGRQTLQGIELAFRIYNNAEPDSNVTLAIEDSGETAEDAVRALERLHSEHRVAAVIGPLTSKGVEEVTQRADELGVPLISMAQKEGKAGDYVFQSSVSAKNQAREVARYAIEKKGLKYFAILHPDNQFGKTYADYFWDAVEEFGGEIRGIESYPKDETTFDDYVKKLVGLYYEDARQRELNALTELRAKDQITKKDRKTEHYFKLEPVVDFEAVFIPDDVKKVSIVLPTFASRDSENVQFIGISTWNSPELVARANRFVESAFFTDIFNVRSEQPSIKKFVARFRETFGREPETLEAVSFDAATLLEQSLMMNAGSTSRSDLKNLLQHVKDFPGVTGRLSYQDGNFFRELKILSVKNKKIVELN